MKTIYHILFSLLFVLAFVGCDDDDDKVIERNQLKLTASAQSATLTPGCDRRCDYFVLLERSDQFRGRLHFLLSVSNRYSRQQLSVGNRCPHIRTQ